MAEDMYAVPEISEERQRFLDARNAERHEKKERRRQRIERAVENRKRRIVALRKALAIKAVVWAAEHTYPNWERRLFGLKRQYIDDEAARLGHYRNHLPEWSDDCEWYAESDLYGDLGYLAKVTLATEIIDRIVSGGYDAYTERIIADLNFSDKWDIVSQYIQDTYRDTYEDTNADEFF